MRGEKEKRSSGDITTPGSSVLFRADNALRRSRPLHRIVLNARPSDDSVGSTRVSWKPSEANSSVSGIPTTRLIFQLNHFVHHGSVREVSATRRRLDSSLNWNLHPM